MRRLTLILMAWLLLAGIDAGTAFAQGRKGPFGPGRRHPPPHPPIERLIGMRPAQRERFLERLPPERRRRLEERLERYRRMSPEERRRLRGEYETFRQLPPEDQEAVRRTFMRFSRFPEDRRVAMRSELDELRHLGEEERRSRIASDEFQTRFSDSERRVLEDLSRLLPAPE